MQQVEAGGQGGQLVVIIDVKAFAGGYVAIRCNKVFPTGTKRHQDQLVTTLEFHESLDHQR